MQPVVPGVHPEDDFPRYLHLLHDSLVLGTKYGSEDGVRLQSSSVKQFCWLNVHSGSSCVVHFVTHPPTSFLK